MHATSRRRPKGSTGTKSSIRLPDTDKARKRQSPIAALIWGCTVVTISVTLVFAAVIAIEMPRVIARFAI